MSKKLTIESVREKFRERGYELLEDVYVDNRTKMKYKCPRHPDEDLYITYGKLQQGQGCRYCGKESMKEKQKLNIIDVRKAFKDRGYTLISDVYVNNRERLRFLCPHHPDEIFELSWNDFSRGYGCRRCSTEKKSSSLKLSFEEVKREFDIRDFILLENSYINSHTKMKYKCSKHPNKEQFVSLNKLKSSVYGCKFCQKEQMSLRSDRKPEFELIKRSFDEKGYILLDTEYKNAHEKLKYICLKHPSEILEITWSQFNLKGSGCKYCGTERASEKTKLSLEEVVFEFDKRGYILLETNYLNNRTKMKYMCPKHPEEDIYIAVRDLKKGKGCPHCAYESKCGENNYNWKGGISPLTEYLRKHLAKWKLNSLKKYNYQCFITNERDKTLEIHHTVQFCDIRDSMVKELNIPIRDNIGKYSREELVLMANRIIEIHEEVEGVPMLKKIHNLFHREYGYHDTTLEQVYEFKERYLNGDFDDQLPINNLNKY